MDLLLPLLTQLKNETVFTLSFEVNHTGPRLLPKLISPGNTRCAHVYRVLNRIKNPGKGWKIRVFCNGHDTGVELDPQFIIDYVRIIFRVVEGGELRIFGVKETNIDIIYRHRFIGFKRNSVWDNRPVVQIHTSETRNVEEHRQAELAPRVYTIPPERLFELFVKSVEYIFDRTGSKL